MKKIGTTEINKVESKPYARKGKGRIILSRLSIKQQKPVSSPTYIASYLWTFFSYFIPCEWVQPEWSWWSSFSWLSWLL